MPASVGCLPKAKAALDDACSLTDWTLHDLRRTAATRMADLGVAPRVIEAILNHVSGDKAGVAGIYNRSTREAGCALSVGQPRCGHCGAGQLC